jgi:hypothetical protein
MAAAVWLVARALRGAGVDRAVIRLVAEIATGATVYTAAVLAIARERSRDLLRLLRAALRLPDSDADRSAQSDGGASQPAPAVVRSNE